MNEDDTTRLIERLAATVPDQQAPVQDVLATCRSTRRRQQRLLSSALAVAATLSVGAAMGIYGTTTPGGPEATASPEETWPNYDAQEMPRVLDELARQLFAAAYPDLDATNFTAEDSSGKTLQPAQYDEAAFMELTYELPGEGYLDVYLGHGRSHAEGDRDRLCASGLKNGSYFECEVFRVGGDVATIEVVARAPYEVVMSTEPYPRDGVLLNVPPDMLETIDPEQLVFTRTVEVVKSDTFVTAVSETVPAPDYEQATASFRVPVEAMVDLAADPALRIPPPPPVQLLEANLEGTWTVRAVVNANGKNVLPRAYAGRVRLTFDEGSMTGTTGCAVLSGAYQQWGQQGRHLSFSDETLSATSAGCPGDPDILAALRGVTGAAGARDESLVLTEGSRIVLYLRPE